MTTYEILNTYPSPYEGYNFIDLVVRFDDLEFFQNIITNKKGVALNAQLQAYADDYKNNYIPPTE